MVTVHPTFEEMLDFARRLSPRQKARLIAELAEELAQSQQKAQIPLPVISEGTWPDNLPLRREELYDDSGRC